MALALTRARRVHVIERRLLGRAPVADDLPLDVLGEVRKGGSKSLRSYPPPATLPLPKTFEHRLDGPRRGYVSVMNDNDPARPLDELLKPGSTLMVGTKNFRGDLEFRPLTVAAVNGARIEILLDTNEEWVRSFADGDEVFVTMSDTRENVWLSMRGRGAATTDASRIDELWNPFASAYFDNGRETPGIAVMMIDGEDGRYWTTPAGRIGSLISMVKAKLGNPDNSGQHGDIDL